MDWTVGGLQRIVSGAEADTVPVLVDISFKGHSGRSKDISNRYDIRIPAVLVSKTSSAIRTHQQKTPMGQMLKLR
jgi:hypothetical protein